MNRGVLQNSPVQQMMATGYPSWWPNINNFIRPPMISSHHQHQSFLSPPLNNNNNNNSQDNNNNNGSIINDGMMQAYTMSMATTCSSTWLDDHPTHHQEQHQQLPESWSQLLLGGALLGEGKKMDTNNWEEQIVLQQQQEDAPHYSQLVDVKQESSVNNYNNNNNNVYNDQDYQVGATTNWSHHHHHQQLSNIPVSSPQSCVTTFCNSNNLLDFSSSNSSENLHSRNLTPTSHTPECNSTATGGATKKAKIQTSSTQSNTTLKVRKEKLGDRITALHQLVSPFGKTDTASVLLEAIGYIRFLQSQIEALSLPYLNNGAGNKRQPHLMQGERKSIFPEDPGQLLNDNNSLKRKGGPDQDSTYEEAKDLRSRGLCLVPISCTLHVGSDNGADYWAPFR